MNSRPTFHTVTARTAVAYDGLLTDLICFSHLRWDFVTQRPQHLLNRASRNRRVFYWEEPIWHAAGELPQTSEEDFPKHLEISRLSERLYVLRPHITWGIDFEVGQRALIDEFIREFSIQNFTVWYYTPMAYGFSKHLSPDVTVYDCMDELSAFAGAPSEMAVRETELLSRADIVFTGGISLFEQKRRRHSNVYAFPSSVDINHFAKAKVATITDPLDQAAIPSPRAGFFGVIDERLDLQLIAAIAELRPNIQFVFLGPVVKINPASLPVAANIHYLGSKSYSDLPEYISGWQVAMLPFALNEATRYISPTKTPEYLAAGKTVVSSPIHDVVSHYGESGLVEIAASPEDFAAALDRAIQPQPPSWEKSVAVALSSNSWDSTWKEMDRIIHEARPIHTAVQAGVGIVAKLSTASPSFKAAVHLQSAFSLSRTVIPSDRTIDYLVVGAGFAGSVIAERLASQLGKRVLIVDKRDHIGGNAYDHLDTSGILVHKYGPHIFHTNSVNVFQYLSQFTEWHPYQHRVLSSVNGQLLPVPINLDTINRLYDVKLDANGMREFLNSRVIPCANIRTSEEIVKSRVGVELYELFFRNYTRKQWGLDPSELDSSVAGRVPVRFDHDDRYFTDTFQAMPLKGYTSMFERILDHPRITVKTQTTYDEAISSHPQAKVIYTGPIDEYYDFRFGPLPYRSLDFRHETLNREVFQPAPVVNFPNEHAYTRITEFKYLTGQKHQLTSVVYEYPKADGDPYYPIPRPGNAALYARYLALTELERQVIFCGRLATYRYLNMDQVVAQGLSTFQRIADSTGAEAVNFSSPSSEAKSANPL